jgi:hypothetical protein
MSRVYHHYSKLEEYPAGLWRQTSGEDRKEIVTRCVEFMSDTSYFSAAMLDVIEQWPLSCEHNLSASNVNRVAWIGQAACCLRIGAPEDCTRVAWHMLSEEKQRQANRAAEVAIEQWDEAQTPTLFGRISDAKGTNRD